MYSLDHHDHGTPATDGAPVTLTIDGAEVTVPAGTFKAWKVEQTSVDGEPGTTTLWIATDSRKVVKLTATLPQMGGAVLTSELQ